MQSAGSAGLFADLKLLEIHIPNGKPGKNGGDALQAFAERLPEDTVTLILLPKLEKAQIQSKWFSALAGKGIVLEAKAVAPHALPQWIQGRLKQQGLDIEPEALALFAERVEGNLLAARQEIEKLALLHPQGHLINIADAEAAVATVARFDVFQLAGAWMKGDALRVSRLLDGLEEEGEEPVLLLWAVAEDIRTLIRLTAALKQGQNIQACATACAYGATSRPLHRWRPNAFPSTACSTRSKPAPKSTASSKARKKAMHGPSSNSSLPRWPLETVATRQETCTQYAPKTENTVK